MSDKTIKRIAVPIIIMLGSALMLGVADGIIYLLRNVIYGVLIFFLYIIQMFWWIIECLVLDIFYGWEFRDIGKSWYEYFTPDDIWICVTIIFVILYACIFIYSLVYMIFGPPEERGQEETESEHTPPNNLLKFTRGYLSCSGILILIIISGFIWFMCYVVGGCD